LPASAADANVTWARGRRAPGSLSSGATGHADCIFGAGSVGSALARAWANCGHQVALATRNPEDPRLANLTLSIGPNATAGAVPRVVGHSEVVVLATPWPAVRDLPGIEADWAGKILIDCTNPLRPDFSWLEDDYQISGAERIAAWAEGASVFKTLNHTGANNMANPAYPDGRPVMFVCGDDARARPTVLGLVAELGFDAVDAGPLKVARLLEPLAMLWIHLARDQGLGREIAFALLRRAGPAG
jgi:predicted dinucleotide-binding enzyme